MEKSRRNSGRNPAEKWILIGIPILFIVAAPLHFLYGWTGNSSIAGLFAPINESVWEHLKLAFWPMLVWWIAGYFILNKTGRISASKWFVSCAVAIVTCILFVLAFFYTYTGALGFESVFLDIFSLFLGLIAGQFLAIHVYNNLKPGNTALFIAVLVLFILAACFIIFTFNPPHLPVFKDPPTGTYGIYKEL